MDLKETIRQLRIQEERSRKCGYPGDAASRAFQRHLLVLLSQKTKAKRKPSEWNLFVGEYARKGKSLKEAAIAWAAK